MRVVIFWTMCHLSLGHEKKALLIVQINKFTNPDPTQARSPSHRLKSKSEQNAITNHFNRNPRVKGSRVVCGAMHSGKNGSVHSG